MEKKEIRGKEKLNLDKELTEIMFNEVKNNECELEVLTTKEVIENVKDLLKGDFKGNISIPLSKETENRIYEIASILQKISETFKYTVRVPFEDTHVFTQKCIKDIYKEEKYNNKLVDFSHNLLINAKNSPLEYAEFFMYGSLVEDKLYITEMLDVLENTLPVVIENLMSNNIVAIDCLLVNLLTISERLQKLCELAYQYYQDNGLLIYYRLFSPVYGLIVQQFDYLTDIS